MCSVYGLPSTQRFVYTLSMATVFEETKEQMLRFLRSGDHVNNFDPAAALFTPFYMPNIKPAIFSIDTNPAARITLSFVDFNEN
jgi:hypothetical protein